MSIWYSNNMFVSDVHHELIQEHQKFVISPYEKEVLRIQSGDRVTAITKDASNGKIKTKQDLPSRVASWPYVNPCVGPIFIESAEPGDTLVVDIERINPFNDWAGSWVRTNLGSLQGSSYTAMISPPLNEEVWILNVSREKVGFITNNGCHEITMPYVPSLGTIGVAPKIEAIHTITAGSHGGNMDCIETTEGNRIFFRVNVPGGMLYFGDAHARQGDGEVSGSSIEMSGEITLRIGIIKNKPISWPRIVSKEYYMTIGCAKPLEDAFRISLKEMVQWITTEFDLTIMDAYKLIEHSIEARIGNIVNPNYCVVSKLPNYIIEQLPRKGE